MFKWPIQAKKIYKNIYYDSSKHTQTEKRYISFFKWRFLPIKLDEFLAKIISCNFVFENQGPRN